MREILSLLVALMLACVAGQKEAEVEASSRSPLNNVQDTICRDGSGKTSWTTTNKAAPWQGRTGHATISFKGKMYMMGGSSASNALLNDVWMSEDGSAWAEMPGSAWGGRKRFGVADWNGKIWMVGGIMDINGQEGTSNEVWSLSSDGSKWEKVLPMSLCTAGQTVCPAAPSPTAVALNRTNGTTAPPPSGSSNPNAVVGMFAQRHSPVVVAHRSRLWVLSGVRTAVDRTAARAEDFMHDVWSSADGVSWQREVETTPWAGRRTSVGITYQTNIFMFVESSQFRYFHHTKHIWCAPTACPSMVCFRLHPNCTCVYIHIYHLHPNYTCTCKYIHTYIYIHIALSRIQVLLQFLAFGQASVRTWMHDQPQNASSSCDSFWYMYT